jgi:hypothetical protein
MRIDAVTRKRLEYSVRTFGVRRCRPAEVQRREQQQRG